MSIGTAQALNLSSPDMFGLAGRTSTGQDVFGLSKTNTVTTSAAAQPASVKQIHMPDGVLKPPNAENRILLLDIDETLAARVEKSDKAKLEKAGIPVYEIGPDKDGKRDEFPYFIERPGAKELLGNLINQGFVLVASTRNMPHHVDTVIKKLGFGDFFLTSFDRFDLNSKENFDFKKYPNHSNNIGWWARVTDWLSRNTVGWFSDALRWIKSVFTKQAVFRNTPEGSVNKYPPHLCGARVLFDDKSENTKHAQRSGDWVHVQIQPFHGNLEGYKASQERDANGNYKWWKEFLDTAKTLQEKGWQELYKTTYKKDPKQTKVEVTQEFNDRLQAAYGFRL